MGSIVGCHAESFGRVPYYAKIVLANYERSVVTVQCDVDEYESIPHAPIFKRFFFGLSALGDGFLEGCSPFLGFDGCHLKGSFGGVILAAIELDRNNGLFLVAFAIVESECKESCGFFFENLSNMLGGFSYDKPWTFMSDRQKEQAYAYISRWVEDKIDVQTSKKKVKRIENEWGSCAKCCKELNKIKEESRKCHLLVAGEHEFEVQDQNINYVVNLRTRTCNCRVWDVSGIPLPDPTFWPQDLEVEPTNLLPPIVRRMPSRPKKNRRKELGEAPNVVRRSNMV
ncbi:hypothetical protein Sango_1924100 [Sesamum angolense]|uniref:MULE transposase domain-containing protein n=1 Tax=Sesamum angolense TaxID=2727404 RepID=A0AAE1WDQ4_9LAMI|nr:hypothetical protein Sango_1924100 [Sesamum angolense]